MNVAVQLKDLPKAITKLLKDHRQAVVHGVWQGAQRGVLIMRGKSPVGVSGQLKASWRVAFGGVDKTAMLVNDAPHVGIIENGARPHPVNAEGIDALTLWAMRKVGLDEKAARGMAFAIAQNLKVRGQPPTFFIKRSMPEIKAATMAEIDAAVKRFAASGKPPAGSATGTPKGRAAESKLTRSVGSKTKPAKAKKPRPR